MVTLTFFEVLVLILLLLIFLVLSFKSTTVIYVKDKNIYAKVRAEILADLSDDERVQIYINEYDQLRAEIASDVIGDGEDDLVSVPIFSVDRSGDDVGDYDNLSEAHLRSLQSTDEDDDFGLNEIEDIDDEQPYLGTDQLYESESDDDGFAYDDVEKYARGGGINE